MSGHLGSALRLEPFTIRVADELLADLQARIRNTRWPDEAPGGPWEQGTDLRYLQRLLTYWADGFDWQARERALNHFSHFSAELDGIAIHFVHERAQQGRGMPLILTHGWPSTFTELLPLVPLLTDPAAHGIDGRASKKRRLLEHVGADRGVTTFEGRMVDGPIYKQAERTLRLARTNAGGS